MRAPGEGHQCLGLCAENTEKMQGCEGVSVVCIFALKKKNQSWYILSLILIIILMVS